MPHHSSDCEGRGPYEPLLHPQGHLHGRQGEEKGELDCAGDVPGESVGVGRGKHEGASEEDGEDEGVGEGGALRAGEADGRGGGEGEGEEAAVHGDEHHQEEEGEGLRKWEGKTSAFTTTSEQK